MEDETNPSGVMEATEGFAADIDGERVIVEAGTTRVEADHELVKRYPQFFKPLRMSYGTEEATANPGERRSRPKAATAAK